MTAQAALVSEEEKVDRRVRRGAVQALVRHAYQATVAEQDREHRGPDAFAQAWQAHLADLLERTTVELPGWSLVTVTGEDIDLAWTIYGLASRARREAIENAVVSRSRRVERGQPVPTFQFAVISEGRSLGDVIYGICQICRIGLLYKIVFDMDWHCCGFGRQALSQLEARHPDVAWYTTGQFKHARGFYDRYRQSSRSPWIARQHPCPHFE
jgi:hypothetical protein